MIPLQVTLLHGVLVFIPFAVFAVVTFWVKPRLWLHSLPKDVQLLTPPKTPREQALTRFVLLPCVLLLLPGLSVVSTLVAAANGGDLRFGGALLHLYGVWATVHLLDFVVIDVLHAAVFIDPASPPIPGTARAKGWTDYGFHFRSFVKAMVMSAAFVVPAAFVLAVLI